MKPITIAGTMTGTSTDGMDVSCVRFGSDAEGRLLWTASRPYPPALRKAVLAVQKPGTRLRIEELLELDARLGDWYGRVLKDLCSRKRGSGKPDAIANHGQTVAHFPGRKGGGGTLQLGDPSRIAEKTGLTVISHFREGDLAAGGQGAPLLPLFHRRIAAEAGGGGVAVHNIGGISNFSYVSPRGELIAFDTGPGNCWIDEAASLATRGKMKMDRDGRLAAKGSSADRAAIRKVLTDHRYFRLRAPKSTGRDDFPFRFLAQRTSARGKDLVATALGVTVESIALAYEAEVLSRKLPLKRILVCGGGAKNPTLLAALSSRMPRVRVESIAALGYDPTFVESQAFAWFGYLSLLGKPITGPWTGARNPGVPGWITPGRNWETVRRRLFQGR